MKLKAIHSGGQTGADEAGLKAAYDLGITTGGIAPKGYRIQNYDDSDGSNPLLGSVYGLVEHESREYKPRTIANVKNTDGTVWFGYTGSPGGKLTLNTVEKYCKPLIINPTSTQLREWIIAYDIEILNVAGNRLSEFNPDIFNTTYDIIYNALI